MEDSKPAENISQAHDPNPPSTAQPPSSDPPPPIPPPPPPPPSESKKRSLENGTTRIMNSKYFKMRLIVKELRPDIIEVLRTPDFRKCEAAREIQEKMKLLMELYKEMADGNSPAQSLPSSGDVGGKQKSEVENRTSLPGFLSEKQQSEDKENPGSYIVGGSAFGWNFITFTGSTPAYYGVTKESFRAAQAKLEGQ